ncbi:MAG: FAD-linked oxidase C-terminal domain-containing protein [Alphaproteobacteria bacterium]|jgi:D-lactate dehydrogenase (cytochrome)|nr:FAD-binding protein [Rhodospirillaceae bacterium]MDG2479447.1 FAD-linked oxidase C-terminal domain-containing protein [Alphaproteobacteria bacterium]
MRANALPTHNDALAELAELLGDRFSTGEAIREQHSHDESWHHAELPHAVVFPETTEEVAQVVTICARHGTPVIPFGTGTSLEGQVVAVEGGVSVDMMRMNRVIEVNAEDLDATVEAGVTRKQLNEYLRDQGLFFPVDPGADASLGGMAATRSSGTNAVRYGTMREAVLSLTVVTADGRIVRTAQRARKSSAGYDLTRLFVGSEGTLGVITEVTVRLFGIPEAISAATVSFSDIGAAVDAVIMTIQSGIPMARIELLDELQVEAINAYSKLDNPVAPTLFLEFHGTQAGVAEQAELVGGICSEFGAGDFRWTSNHEERNKLWQARHDAAWASKALRPGCSMWVTDVCVPISRLAECIVETKKDLETTDIPAPLVGHVGDGNFHLAFLLDRDDPAELAEAERINDRLVNRALAMGGTCTGEHGVGLGKMKFLQAEHGEAVSLMRQLKAAFDPQGIMNPGKIVAV